jgi:hypothetical protein
MITIVVVKNKRARGRIPAVTASLLADIYCNVLRLILVVAFIARA